ncbi:type II secretion system F family protein [Stenotrophomonas sp. JAI102]|uniref:type II secretion system F family protein n=1 Tax=Stenotrophomonas sp. JAI102 TaxID=2723077 RepID=UPI0015C7324E|nr:type II secretion system F family protein [Stenotrophomonas sp. JAI102]NYF34935.1 tight adherence protein C [Stenotrophomonas sp. JAI102]
MTSSGWWIASLLVLATGVALLGVRGWVLSSREQRNQETLQAALRPRDVPGSPSPPAQPPLSLRQRWLKGIAAFGQRFNGGRIEAALLAPEDRLLLDQAGWNTQAGTAIFLGLRLLIAVATLVLVLAFNDSTGFSRAMAIFGALAFGILLPKFALRTWAMRLRKQVSAELPLLIDLLRLLQGVGFSMDQSLQTLGDKLRNAVPVLGREIHQANIAYMHGRSREQSLRRLGESFDDEDLRSLVQLILQVHAHGGAVQEPLRQFSIRLREQRRSTLKEKVGKLSVKMTVVMMLTLLPALMLVLAGPAIIALASALTQLD